VKFEILYEDVDIFIAIIFFWTKSNMIRLKPGNLGTID